MPDLSTIRHDSIFNASKRAIPAIIIGAGATGSRVFASLVELGCTDITIVDFDIVESHNLANQIYREADVGWLKVEACRNWYQHKTGRPALASMYFIDQKVDAENTLANYTWAQQQSAIFLLVDSMAARREIFEQCIRPNPYVQFMIETRMASSYGDVYALEPQVKTDAKAWLATLTDDEVAEASPCGGSISVGPTANIIANLAVWRYINYCNAMAETQSFTPSHQRLYLTPELITAENKL